MRNYNLIADQLDRAVYPAAAIEAIREIESEAVKRKHDVVGFRIIYHSDGGSLKIERITRSLAWRGHVKPQN